MVNWDLQDKEETTGWLTRVDGRETRAASRYSAESRRPGVDSETVGRGSRSTDWIQ